jgi:hypothetical protein
MKRRKRRKPLLTEVRIMMVFDPKRNRLYDDGETVEEMKIRKNRIRRILRKQALEMEERAKEIASRPRCSCGMILPRVGVRCICGKK